VIFYADRGLNETMYNNKLTLHAVQDLNTPGKRWGSVASADSYEQTLTSFEQTTRFEQDGYSMYMLYSPNTLYVNKTFIFTTKTKSFPFNLPGVSLAGNVNLDVRLYSQYDYDPVIDLGANLTLNAEASTYAYTELEGHVFKTQSNTLAASRFIDKANTLNINAVKLPGIKFNRLRLDYIEATYPRELKSYNDQLLINHDFNAKKTLITATGFTDPTTITILDVTDPTKIVEYTGATLAPHSITFSSVGADHRSARVSPTFTLGIDTDLGPNDPKHTRTDNNKTKIFFVNLTTAVPITSTKKITPNKKIRGRRSPVDHLLITDETLNTKAQDLVEHLESQGQRVELVNYQDLCTEYSDGEYTTTAIKRYVVERWKTAPYSDKPQYLTIIGSGNFNTKGLYSYHTELALIPSVMLRSKYAKKASAADWEYAKITDDKYPDLAVGRLDCGTVVELDVIITKIKSYEALSKTTQPKALLVTDHDPTFDLYLFDGYLNLPSSYLDLSTLLCLDCHPTQSLWPANKGVKRTKKAMKNHVKTMASSLLTNDF